MTHITNLRARCHFLGIPVTPSIPVFPDAIDLSFLEEKEQVQLISSLTMKVDFIQGGLIALTDAVTEQDLLDLVSIAESLNLRRKLKVKSSVNRFEITWGLSELLFGEIFSKSIFKRPIKLRHPFIFYSGHLPAFFVNQMKAFLEFESVSEEFDLLFERGIDPDENGVMHHTHSADVNHDAWPAYETVSDYSISCHDLVKELIPRIVDMAYETDDVLIQRCRILEIGIEHEYMHQETLLYMANQLDLEDIVKPEFLDATPDLRVEDDEIEPSFAHIPGNTFRIGADLDDEKLIFGWDNEFPSQEVTVQDIECQKTPVTNAMFKRFYDAGGYDTEGLWNPRSWSWKNKNEISHPVNWINREGHWFLRVLFAEIPLEDAKNLPVQVSHAEAVAYCNWAGGRLPTEPEWQHAAYSRQNENGDLIYSPFPWGDDAPTDKHANFGFKNWSPSPVNAHPEGTNHWGLQDLLGNGWEWTSSTFCGFEGYTPYIRTYPGYSADFFDNDHYVMKGGSFATCEEILRPSFRNWFREHYPYVFSQFRVIKTK